MLLCMKTYFLKKDLTLQDFWENYDQLIDKVPGFSFT